MYNSENQMPDKYSLFNANTV